VTKNRRCWMFSRVKVVSAIENGLELVLQAAPSLERPLRDENSKTKRAQHWQRWRKRQIIGRISCGRGLGVCTGDANARTAMTAPVGADSAVVFVLLSALRRIFLRQTTFSSQHSQQSQQSQQRYEVLISIFYAYSQIGFSVCAHSSHFRWLRQFVSTVNAIQKFPSGIPCIRHDYWLRLGSSAKPSAALVQGSSEPRQAVNSAVTCPCMFPHPPVLRGGLASLAAILNRLLLLSITFVYYFCLLLLPIPFVYSVYRWGSISFSWD